MAARKNPSRGGKPDKIMRDALMIELKREAKSESTGKKTNKLNLLVAKLVEKALEGDVPCLKEIWDRVEGRPAQAVTLSGDNDNPLEVIHSVAPDLARKLDRFT